MKKSIFTTALLISSLLFAGCNNAQTDNTNNQIQSDNSEVISSAADTTDNSEVDSENEDKIDTSATSSHNNSNKTKNPVKNVSTNLIAGKGQPKVGTIKRIEQGDLACYVTLVDEKGKEHNLSADFEICPQKEQFLNKKVKLSYKILTFNDCQSNEPCGKTKKESAIVKMEVIGSAKPVAGKGQPKIGTIKRIEQGDLACYVNLIDETGKEHNISADFNICADKEKFINKRVKLSYKILNFNDCQSNEPCGKTKKESAIVKMEVIGGSKSEKSSGDTQTLSNGEWTIKLSNYDSWDGVNNTGNVKYNGCDSKGNCLELTGGKVSCRNGKCVTGWKNGSYVYVIESAITEDGNNPQGSTLIVRQNGKVIVREQSLQPV
ncbi:MAG: hypothetical protein KI793_16220 [Rivularia sp. (in: Bacteria)]|nr:hypothetical protein [Rivularia sp. MS3]